MNDQRAARDWRAHISGYLDDELDPEDRAAFERELARDGELARELDALRTMKGVTDGMRLMEFTDSVWDRYWEETYNRLERRIGWLLFSAGAAVLLAGGLYQAAVALLADAGGPLWIRLAAGALAGGLALLFVSVVRERCFAHRRDPYREVKR